jgi:DNA (cytosine-5)-methyltransferase 1
VLSASFVEHLMGLPAGWLTDVPLPRVDQLRILGNGVVPHQAAFAVSMLLDDFRSIAHASVQGRAA